jgi:hypothetical protein
MAGVRFTATTAKISTGTALKTLIQVVAAANHRLLIDEISISFDGVVQTDEPILVEVLRQTTAGTMTALTCRKNNDADDETLQVTAQHTATAEPTAGDLLKSWLVHPQTGRPWQAPFGREIVVKGSGRLGIRVTAAASVDAVVEIGGEE